MRFIYNLANCQAMKIHRQLFLCTKCTYEQLMIEKKEFDAVAHFLGDKLALKGENDLRSLVLLFHLSLCVT